jgi:hypothetical protein
MGLHSAFTLPSLYKGFALYMKILFRNYLFDYKLENNVHNLNEMICTSKNNLQNLVEIHPKAYDFIS